MRARTACKSKGSARVAHVKARGRASKPSVPMPWMQGNCGWDSQANQYAVATGRVVLRLRGRFRHRGGTSFLRRWLGRFRCFGLGQLGRILLAVPLERLPAIRPGAGKSRLEAHRLVGFLWRGISRFGLSLGLVRVETLRC
jgi:hypothetical protein